MGSTASYTEPLYYCTQQYNGGIVGGHKSVRFTSDEIKYIEKLRDDRYRATVAEGRNYLEGGSYLFL